MVWTEIAEGKTIQVPAVGGIAKGAEISVVGGNDNGAAAVSQQPVELFHGAYYVNYVFDHVDGAYLAEGAVSEREREVIEVGNDVGSNTRVAIQAYSARVFVKTAAAVENGQLTD